jgi:peptide/nickel transport system permease protein
MARSSPQVKLNLWQRFRRLDPQMRLGSGMLLLIVLLSLLVPLLSPYNAERSADTPLLRPSLAHPFGTDQLGRDLFVRAFAAARLDLVLAVIGVSVPLTIGTFIGAVAGTTRIAAVSYIWRAVVDAINALPFFVLVMAVVAMLGQGVTGMLLAIALTNWARYARLARARSLALREVEFIRPRGSWATPASAPCSVTWYPTSMPKRWPTGCLTLPW